MLCPMATAITDRIPIEQITAEARGVPVSRVLAVLFFGTFWLLGYSANRLWLGVVICGVSVRRGWRDSAGWQPPVQQQYGPEIR